MKLFEEIKRRNVFHVGATYILLGWLVIQVTDTVAPALNLPDWTLAFVTWIGVIGFPFVIFFSWAYELTPEGIKPEQDVDRDNSITQVTGRRLNMALIGLLVITGGFIASDFVSDSSDSAMVKTPVTDVTTASQAPDQPALSADSIAVLPLLNMSTISENAFFAAGVHEEILTNLSRIDELQVVSRTTALRYVDSNLSLREIGQELGVRYIVEGSVRRINNHVRITVQLVDATNDVHVWANNYDRELVDVFSTQSEVARAITNSLHLEVQPETVGTLSDMPTDSVLAYDLYIQALSIDRSEPESESALQRQRELLEAAVNEDPLFVEAWGFLNEILDHSARNIIQLEWFGETDEERKQNFQEIRLAAENALRTAVSLDPDNVETLLAQASDFVKEQEQPGFNGERRLYIDRALEIEPNNAIAWLVLGWWHRIMGDNEAATPAFHRALELDPLHTRIVYSSLLHFRLAGDQQMTTKLFERLAQIAPEKGEETRLSEIPEEARRGNFVMLFSETADESLIEKFATDIEASAIEEKGDKNDEDGLYDLSQDWISRAMLFEVRNDAEALANLDPPPLHEDADNQRKFFHVRMLTQVLAAQRIQGLEEQAQLTARRIMDVSYSPDEPYAEVLDNLRLAAHFVLKDEQALQRGQQALIELGDTPFKDTPFWFVVLFQHADSDRVIKHLLAHKEVHPDWFGTDVVAMFHMFYRPLVAHPELKAFYVNEGKWVDYLATRVPEYAAHDE